MADVNALAKQANQDLRAAQNLMFSGKKEEALEATLAVGEILGRIEAEEPDLPALKGLKSKFEKQKADIERRLGKGAAPAKSSSPPAPPKRPAPPPRSASASSAPAPSGDAPPAKLPGGVTKRLRDIQSPLEGAETYLERKSADYLKWTRQMLDSAQSFIDEIEKGYGSQLPDDCPEVEEAKARIAALEERLAAATEEEEKAAAKADEEKAALEAVCAEWLARIQPLTAFGSDQRLAFDHTADPQELVSQRERLAAAEAVAEEYAAGGPGEGASYDLDSAAEALGGLIEEARSTYTRSIERAIAGVEDRVDEQLAMFERDQAWREDPSKTPRWVQSRDLDSIDEALVILRNLVPVVIPEDDPALLRALEKHERLSREDAERRDTAAEQTVMLPEIYAGDDADALRTHAGTIVTKEKAEAEILRVHLIKADWRVESITEFSDTSRTKLRHRTTHWLPAQVAAKLPEGVYLYTVHIAKNEQRDGFGPLYGNTEPYPHRMLEKNLP